MHCGASNFCAAGDATGNIAVRRSDMISGALLLVFGLVMIFVIVPIQISSSSEYGLDPKFFPDALLWLLVAMGALLVATRVRLRPEPADAEPVLDLWNWLFIGGFTIFLIIVFVAINNLGFVLAGAMMIAVLMFALGLRHLNWIELVCVSVLAPLVIYYALYHVFSVRLPSGVLLP